MADLWVLCEHGEAKRHAIPHKERKPLAEWDCPGGHPWHGQWPVDVVERITRILYEADALFDRRAAGYHKALVRVVLDALSDSLAKESS